MYHYNYIPDIPMDVVLANFSIIKVNTPCLFGGLDALINSNEYRITFTYNSKDVQIESFCQRKGNRLKLDKLERFGAYSNPLKQAILNYIQSHIKSKDVTALEIYPE